MDHLDNGMSDDFEDGCAAFLCDICELWYNTTDLGYIANRISNSGRRYSLNKIDVCVECVEFIGGDYDD